jgi:hypothetical protein
MRSLTKSYCLGYILLSCLVFFPSCNSVTEKNQPAASSASNQQGKDLQFKIGLSAGNQLSYQLESIQYSHNGDSDQPNTSKVTCTIILDCLSKMDTNYTFKGKFTAFNMLNKNFIGEESFDLNETNNNAKNLYYLSNLKHATFNLTVSENGIISNLSGLDSFYSKLDANTQKSLLSLYSDNKLKKDISSIFLKNATQRIYKVKDTWTDSISDVLLELNMGLKSINQYTYQSASDALAQIDIKSNIICEPIQIDSRLDMHIKLGGDATSQYFYNINKGFVEKDSTYLTMNGFIEAMGKKYPIKITSETVVNVKLIK